jgi:hypothetical protein
VLLQQAGGGCLAGIQGRDMPVPFPVVVAGVPRGPRNAAADSPGPCGG